MRVSTKRILSIGFAGIFLVGALVVYGSAIRPEVTKVFDERSLVASKENLFQTQQTAVNDVKKLIAQYQQNIGNVQDVVSVAMPRGENVTEALNQIQGMVSASGVQLSGFSVKSLAFDASNQQLVKRLGTLVFNMTIQGSYEGIKGFLRALETNVRVANVKGMTIAPVTDSTGVSQDLYNLILTVNTFYQE